MEKIESRFDCRIEELPTLSKFLRDSLVRDSIDFNAYSPDFNPDYLKSYDEQRQAVIDLIFPKKITGEKKKITARMYAFIASMRPNLNKLEGYVKRASKTRGVSLTVGVKDFGILQVRHAIGTKDVEELDGAMKYLKKNITDNYAPLVAKGYSDEQRDTLYSIWALINADNEAQNLKDDERDKLVEANIGVLNTLWDTMVDICSSGKIIYKDTEPAKVNDYTMSTLKNRIRQEPKIARFKNKIVPLNSFIEIENVASGEEAKNTGKVNLLYRDKTASEQTPWKAGEEIIINSLNGTIVITNNNPLSGSVSVKAFPKK